MSKENKENAGNKDKDDKIARRKLRADYRSLQNDLEETGEAATNPDSNYLHTQYDKCNDLFSEVRHPREAVQDSLLLLKLAKKSREQAQQLKIDAVTFDNPTFADKIITYVNARRIDDGKESQPINLNPTAWKKLGDRACQAFTTAPKIDFLLGPLVIEVVIKEKVVRNAEARKKNTEGELVKLTQVESGGTQEEATTKEVERIYKILKKRTKDGRENVCFFRFIINPTSFGQTVENIFHLSFLIKDGRVVIDLDDDNLPYINLHAEVNEEDCDGGTRKQVVMPLTMKDWQQLIDAYEITDSIIPTRQKIHK